MRTSHIAIRRRIQNVKNKLTDEQIFHSREYAAYLTDIVDGATLKYKRARKVVTSWDEREDAQIACTDNRIIHINTGNHLSQSFPTRVLRAESLLGIIGHEIGHLLYTDFTMLNTHQSHLSAGHFYPEEPADLSPAQQRSLTQIRKCFDDEDTAAVKALCLIASNLSNIVEDVYIEARICDAFPGSFRTGILMNNIRFAEDMPSVNEQIAKANHEVSIVANLIIQYAKSGDINNLGGYTGVYLDALYHCIPFIDECVYDDDARARYAATNQMLLILWPFMKSLIEQIREDEKNETNKAEAELDEQIKKGSTIASGSGKPIPGKAKFKHDPTAETEEKGNIKEVIDYESGRIELEKTDELDEGNNGGISYDRDFAGSGYLTQAMEDMQRVLTEIAEDVAVIQYEEDLAEELQNSADEIRYGNAHMGIHVHVNRMGYVDDCYKEGYARVAPPLLLISKRLQKQVLQVLKDWRDGGKLNGLLMGKRINARSLIHDDGKIFYKRNLPNSQLGIAVVVLNDESGSMGCQDRVTKARSASIVIHDFCRQLQIPVAIYGHTEDDDVEMFAYAEFDSIDGKDGYRLMDMSARSGNRDGAALRFAAEQLLKRPEELKLLFIISDGQPAGSGYYGTEAEADLRGIKLEYNRKGVKLFAAAIGDDKPNIQRIYGDGFLDITDLNKLPINLGKLIIQHVKQIIAA